MTFTHKVNSFYHSQKASVEEVLLHIINDLLSALLSLIVKALLRMCMELRHTYQSDSSGSYSVLDLLLSQSYLVLYIHRFQIPELNDLTT